MLRCLLWFRVYRHCEVTHCRNHIMALDVGGHDEALVFCKHIILAPTLPSAILPNDSYNLIPSKSIQIHTISYQTNQPIPIKTNSNMSSTYSRSIHFITFIQMPNQPIPKYIKTCHSNSIHIFLYMVCINDL